MDVSGLYLAVGISIMLPWLSIYHTVMCSGSLSSSSVGV